MKHRINNLHMSMNEKNIDGMVIMKPENRMYMSGFTGSSGIVIVSAKENVLLTDFRYIEQAAIEAENFKIVQHGPSVMDSIKETVFDMGITRLGFENDFMTYQTFESAKQRLTGTSLIATNSIIENLRMIKNEDEIQSLLKAADIADKTFEHIVQYIKAGVTEIEVAIEIDYHMRKIGSMRNSFPTIVASAERGSLPHAQPSSRKIANGDFITMDFGAVIDGYCSDLTRTVILGKSSEEQKRVYNIVLESQKIALDSISAGMPGCDIDLKVRKYMGKFDLDKYFGHGLGHGVGLYIHENPRLSQTSTDILAPGHAVTVEPGIYIPDWGGVRIEDLVIIMDDHVINLTKSAKEWGEMQL